MRLSWQEKQGKDTKVRFHNTRLLKGLSSSYHFFILQHPPARLYNVQKHKLHQWDILTACWIYSCPFFFLEDTLRFTTCKNGFPEYYLFYFFVLVDGPTFFLTTLTHFFFQNPYPQG